MGKFIREPKSPRLVKLENGLEQLTHVNLAHIEGGVVLMSRDRDRVTRQFVGEPHLPKPVFDNNEREFQGVELESEPGRRPHKFFSGDAGMIRILRSLKRGDVINASGVQYKSGAVRIEKLEVVSKAEAPSAAAPAA